jgi:hypothetical protein
MQKYGIALEQLSQNGQVAVQAAERLGARTLIYRDKLPVAAIVPASDLEKLAPAELTEAGEDPLLSLCGTFSDDAFVDRLSDLQRTVLFNRSSKERPSKKGSKKSRAETTRRPPPPPGPPLSRGRRS